MGDKKKSQHKLQQKLVVLLNLTAGNKVDSISYFVDMIAIPNFIYGGMENWGLITYRDWNLLFKPNVSSAFNKQRVAEVVTHELAHQVKLL